MLDRTPFPVSTGALPVGSLAGRADRRAIHPAIRRNRNERSHAGSRWRFGRHEVRYGLQTDAGPVAHRVAAPGNTSD